jgi:hypothetical protein
MTTLAQLADGLVSMQCDLCVPPVLTVGTPAWMGRIGWSLRSDGESLDACPNCSVRVAPRNRVARGDGVPVEPDPSRMPNVIVVGAMKAGTTSMHNYLAAHPEIEVSWEKEMRFFTDPACRSWIGAYQDHFRPGTRYRAESTPYYTKYPCFPGVVDRMADLVPEARIIYLVRDPIGRALAEYVEQVKWKATDRTAAEEFADPHEPTNALVASSRYATQLEEFFRRFGREQVLVLDLADLAEDVAAAMNRTFAFLDLEPLDLSSEDYGRYNTREDKRALPGWLLALRRGPLVRAARRLPAGPRKWVTHLAWRRTGAQIEPPQLDERTLAGLRDALAPEVSRLRELTGQSFPTWTL